LLKTKAGQAISGRMPEECHQWGVFEHSASRAPPVLSRGKSPLSTRLTFRIASVKFESGHLKRYNPQVATNSRIEYCNALGKSLMVPDETI
jgi:hypothetical protein